MGTRLMDGLPQEGLERFKENIETAEVSSEDPTLASSGTRSRAVRVRPVPDVEKALGRNPIVGDNALESDGAGFNEPYGFTDIGRGESSLEPE